MDRVAVLASLAVWEDQDNMEHELQEDMKCSLMEISVTGGQVYEETGQRLGVMSVEAQPSVITWTKLQDATREDKVLTKLIEVIQRGMPDSSNELLKEVRDFHKYRHGLVVVDGVVTYKRRLVIPDVLRGEILETLHAAHQGVSGMINRAEQSVFWPHITTVIEKMRARCKTCVRNSPSQPAGKPVAPPSPSYPFQRVREL